MSNASSGIGRLSTASAADAWPGGAAPLMRWLRANPDVLGGLVGLELEGTADEVPGLEAAVFAAPEGGRLLAVVELGRSSEATLGSLLTRLSTARAGMAVWICGEARDEHVAAISWLNRAVEGRFHLVRVRAARIGASDVAPIFEVVLRPPRAADPHDATGPSASGGDARRAGDHPQVVLPE